MANAIKFSALGTFTTAIAGAGVAPTLKALANNGRKLGGELDLTAGGARQREANWDLYVRGASAFTAGGTVELYFVKSIDGTNYETGDDSTTPQQACLVGVFYLGAVSTQQRLSLAGIPLPNCKFKPLLINKGGQAFTNTDDENILSYRTYDPNEVQ